MSKFYITRNARRFNRKMLTVGILTMLVFLSDCNIPTAGRLLESWTGDYQYEETPIKANAGYQMVMDWNLSVSYQNDSCVGTLELKGQQTFMKLKTDIKGDTSKIAIIYNHALEGNSEELKGGDTLFILSNTHQGLITKWNRLEPRLSDVPFQDCKCFYQVKKLAL